MDVYKTELSLKEEMLERREQELLEAKCRGNETQDFSEMERMYKENSFMAKQVSSSLWASL